MRPLQFRQPMGLALLSPVLAQSTMTDLAPSLIIAALPSCATSCFVNALQSGDCSLASTALLADCLCTSVAVQSSYSSCTQQNCTMTEAVSALLVENEICKSYPSESRANEALVAAAITYIISIPVIVARCVARIKYSNRLWSDDYVSIAATLFLVLLATIQVLCVRYGFGLHQWEAEILTNSKILAVLLYVSQIFYTLVQCLARVSILLLYKRIFGMSVRWFRWTVNALLVLAGVVGVSYTLLLIFQCWPIAAAWDLTIENSKCFDFAPLLFSAALLSIVVDFVMMGIPIPELKKLQISGRKQIGVGVMFTIASLGVVASLVRLQYLVKMNWSYDLSWDEIDVVVWSLIELLCIVVCGSLPALRPYFRSLGPKLAATWRRSTESFKRTRTSVSRRSAGTAYSLGGQKDEMPYDPLQLHPLSSVQITAEWSKLPDEPQLPPPAVGRTPSMGYGKFGTAPLPKHIRTTKSYFVSEFWDSSV